MARLIYSAITSLDGYIEDADGRFDWGVPDEETHAFINDLARPVRTYLYGRRMYEVMSAWETDSTLGEQSPAMRGFAEIWRAADKVVYSSTLDAVSTSRTRLERRFDPDAIRKLKRDTDADMTVAGPELAGHAFRAGLVDECQLFLAPVACGAGKRGLPEGVRLDLVLIDERRFPNGMVFLRYDVTS
jgi:dihydrofolate reductase